VVAAVLQPLTDLPDGNISSSPAPVNGLLPTSTSTSTPIPTRVPFYTRVPGAPFTHPGVLNNQADLDFVKAQLAAGKNPWARAFNEMKVLATRFLVLTNSAVCRAR